MILGNAKDALDTGRIADADLDMRLVEEAGPLVDLAAFGEKHALDGIEGLKRRPRRKLPATSSKRKAI
jgi:hypothetical protein